MSIPIMSHCDIKYQVHSIPSSRILCCLLPSATLATKASFKSNKR